MKIAGFPTIVAENNLIEVRNSRSNSGRRKVKRRRKPARRRRRIVRRGRSRT